MHLHGRCLFLHLPPRVKKTDMVPRPKAKRLAVSLSYTPRVTAWGHDTWQHERGVVRVPWRAIMRPSCSG